jgi:deoxyadenosine/deoxycytidine kinase
MRIELVGGLGIGKSTLCQALEKIGFNCIYENLKTNPFLADCFVNPEDFRFPSQMWFVLSKFHEIKKYEDKNRVNVLDQAVMNVRAYTNMLFKSEDPEALTIIDQCFDYMEMQAGQPDLLINLKCSPIEQMNRIRGRNRDHEKDVSLDYICELQSELNQLINLARVDGQAVLDIDTEAVYLPNNVDYAKFLAEQISKICDVDIDYSFLDQTSSGQEDDEKPPITKYIELAEAV